MARQSAADKAAENLAQTGNPGANTNQDASAGPSGDAQATISGLNEAAGIAEPLASNSEAPTPPVVETEAAKPTNMPPGDAAKVSLDVSDSVKHLESLGYTVTAPGGNPEKSDEEKEASLVAEYGEGYVTAERGKGATKETTYFNKQAWNNLDGDKGGWKRVVKTPPEVEELNAAKANS